MHYALAPYVGRGTRNDPFRPRGSEQPGWAAIDLRPDSTRVEGYALLKTPERVRGAIDLGPSPDDRWSMRPLASRLGVSLSRSTLRSAAARLLLSESREDGTRWRPIWPEVGPFASVYRIWLGGLLWEQPVLAGGVSFTETWTASNSASLTADQTWVEDAGTAWEIFSNQARCVGAGTNCVARCTTALASNDHSASVTIVTFTWTVSTLTGEVICRKTASGTLTFYAHLALRTAAQNEHKLQKTVAGVETQLGSSDTTDVSNGEVIYVEANGTSITGKLGGTINIGPITDSAIDGTTVGGKQVGIRSFGNVGNTVIVDGFAGADLAGAATSHRVSNIAGFHRSWRA